jgi:Domain of unknown function (DUF4279)
VIPLRDPSSEARPDAGSVQDAESHEHRHLRYHVRLPIRHPSLDAGVISRELGIGPRRSWTVGDPVTTPTGTILEGRYYDTRWSISEEVLGRRFFFESAFAMLEQLEKVPDFIRSITESGGSVCVTFDLSGEHNIGNAIDWKTLARFAALKVNLGVEVF